MTARRAPTCGTVVVTLLLAGCGGATAGSSAPVPAPDPALVPAPATASSGPAATPRDDLDCGSAMVQGWTTALAEGSGFPTVEEAVAHARGYGALPAGEVDVADPARGRVRSGGVVVAEFVTSQSDSGWYVTSGTSCASG